MLIATKAKSWFWLGYFVLTIAALGAVIGYGLVAPLHLIGRVWPAARRLADSIMYRGVSLMMWLQPWYFAEVNVSPALELVENHHGFLIVSNHRSHLDAFVLLSKIRGVRILAKKALFQIPLMGTMMRATQQIPTDRGKVTSFLEALEVIRKRLRSGDPVHVFPEMTRCEKGFQGTKDFNLAPFWIAAQEGVPIIPLAFKGTDQVWPKGRMGIRYRKRISVKALDPLYPQDYASAEALKAEAQRRINQALL